MLGEEAAGPGASTSSPRRGTGRGVGLALWMLACIALVPAGGYRTLNSLPDPGDGPDYDSIALSLSEGRGFGFDFDSASFRAPYVAANSSGQYDYLLARRGHDATTYKPPLFPIILAATYKAFGRQWMAVRLFNIAATSLAIVLVAGIVAQVAGRWPAALAVVLLVVVDKNLRWWTTAVLTESLAALAVASVTRLLAECAIDQRPSRVVYAGVAAGMATLVRSVFVLWLPCLAVMVALIVRPGIRMRSVVLFLSAVLVVSAPWFARNCTVLGSFSPLGTQGDINLGAGYSDEALATHGEWSEQWWNRVHGPGWAGGNHTLEREREMAARGRYALTTWISAHRADLARLAVSKVVYSWAHYGRVREWLLLLLAVIALLFAASHSGARIVLGVLVIHTGVIGATYWYNDQFMVPVRSLVAAGAALGVAAAVRATRIFVLTSQRHRSS
jgi:dolichyl-phosphate-mannose-protein mannosyltransferase